MSYNHKDYKNMQVAKNRLKKTVEMVRASKEYKNGSYRADAVSMLAQSMLPHLKKNSLKALHIYEAVLGGWHADLELRGMPTGINRMLGTPVASPCDTREEAENFGYHLVATVLSMIESGSLSALDEKAIDGSLAFFEFYGVSFGLEIDFLNQLADRKTGGIEDEYRAFIETRLKTMEELYVLDGDFNQKKWDEESHEQRRELIAVMAYASTCGIFRWPPNEALPPKKMRH